LNIHNIVLKKIENYALENKGTHIKYCLDIYSHFCKLFRMGHSLPPETWGQKSDAITKNAAKA